MLGITTYNRRITTLTPSKVLKLTKTQFWELWSEQPQFSKAVFNQVCIRLLQTGNERVFNSSTFLRQQVYRLINLNLNKHGYFRYEKEVLRELLGVPIRSLNRALRELENEQLISITAGAIRVWPPDRCATYHDLNIQA